MNKNVSTCSIVGSKMNFGMPESGLYTHHVEVHLRLLNNPAFNYRFSQLGYNAGLLGRRFKFNSHTSFPLPVKCPHRHSKPIHTCTCRQSTHTSTHRQSTYLNRLFTHVPSLHTCTRSCHTHPHRQHTHVSSPHRPSTHTGGCHAVAIAELHACHGIERKAGQCAPARGHCFL